MKSDVIRASQLTLDFEPGLTQRYMSLRDCVSTRIYQRGLSTVAIDLDEAPGNLSVQLSDSDARKFGIDSFERYLEKSKDTTPIYYLIEKFLRDKTATKEEALSKIAPALAELVPLLKQAGLV